MTSEMQLQYDTSWLDSGNQSYLDNQYEAFLNDPNSVPSQWRIYFQNLVNDNQQNMDVSHAQVQQFFKNLNFKTKKDHLTPSVKNDDLKEIAVQKLIFFYRLLGHLQSNINPLENYPRPLLPELQIERFGLTEADLSQYFLVEDLEGAKERTLTQIITDLQQIYCGTLAVEYLHIDNTEERLWVQHNLEGMRLNYTFSKEQKLNIYELVAASDGLEKYLNAKYPGAKRFSLEGCDSLLVGLDEIISNCGKSGIQEIVLAMTHRGRLNVLVNLMGKLPSELFDQFEDRHNILLESGDVKYHQGFGSDLKTDFGNVHISMVFNPSHLEIVTPVACGAVRARQERRGIDGINKVLSIAIHGDAAFAGQGVVMEILNMSATRGYGVGGTIHIIVNNQIGFTTSNPKDARSTLYCSDIGKMLSIPIFHVNSDDPEAVLEAFKIALDYKIKFQKDVIIDLVGYRRMGHNEADEPAATQPIMYKKIRALPSVKDLYAEQLVNNNVLSLDVITKINEDYRKTLDMRDRAVVRRLIDDSSWRNNFIANWSLYNTKDWRTQASTQVDLEILKTLANARDTVPDGFVLDARVQKIVEARRNMTEGLQPVDWGYAETLAYASLLNEGYGVRLSGQDSGRGTFFHRHAVWHDQNTGATYVSLANLPEQKAKFTIIDSLLSEEAVLAFEYGFSTTEPRTLTLWEAQFGDFANGAQVVVDQFISSGEQKWGRLSGLVLLLPHGYEGQGPEHSSARIERYLQLCAQYNMQVCIPSTPAQMYHLLRRQILRPMRKPLIVITPKSLLRHRAAISNLNEIANGAFNLIIDNTSDYSNIERVVLCSGKVYYDLKAAIEDKKNIAIIRIEQIYPFPEEELQSILKKYTHTKTIIWCQEEPKNQGVWYSMQHHLLNALAKWQQLFYTGRPESAAPAVGYFHLHEQQQKELVMNAIGEES